MKSVVFSALLVYLVYPGAANPVLVSPIDTQLKPEDSFNCPAGYSQPANSNWTYCYKVFNSYADRESAAAQCNENYGTLASIPNAFVNSYLVNLARQNNDFVFFYLGLQCFNGDSNTCVNDDGTPFVYDNFVPLNPNMNGTCAYMATYGRTNAAWASTNCSQSLQFACEVRAGPQTTTLQPSTTPRNANLTCPPNYTEFNSMCYSYVYMGWRYLSGETAAANCSRVPGGMLATISNWQINVFLTSIKPNGGVAVTGLVCSDILFPGDTRSCYWDDGTPFNYSTFAKGYPVGSVDNGCCEFDNGVFYNCYHCDAFQFNSYICQAPMQDPSHPITTTPTAPHSTTKGPPKCPDNYKEFKNSICYNWVYVSPIFGNDHISANNASKICSQVPGGMLATIPNEEVNYFVRTIQPSIHTDYAVFGLVCPEVKSNGDISSCKWDDGTPFEYQAFMLPNWPYWSGCCDFSWGTWSNCYDCDATIFKSYICQAPKQ